MYHGSQRCPIRGRICSTFCAAYLRFSTDRGTIGLHSRRKAPWAKRAIHRRWLRQSCFHELVAARAMQLHNEVPLSIMAHRHRHGAERGGSNRSLTWSPVR